MNAVERWIEVDELFNSRDLGGLGGVRRGLLYRTDALCGLAESGREAYRALGIHTVIDLRRPEEIEAQGRAPEWAYASWHNITLREGAWPVGDCPDVASLPAYLAEIYLSMSENGAADIVRVLGLLADEGTGPAVIHCAGGRDRTGVVVALLLELLGVPDEEIALDYHLSERFTQRWLAWKEAQSGEVPVLPLNLLYTPEEAILLFLEELRRRHGSIVGYLLGSGLEPAAVDRLRARYL
jgi:protein-tyrosine phosphatase